MLLRLNVTWHSLETWASFIIRWLVGTTPRFESKSRIGFISHLPKTHAGQWLRAGLRSHTGLGSNPTLPLACLMTMGKSPPFPGLQFTHQWTGAKTPSSLPWVGSQWGRHLKHEARLGV